VGNRKRKKRRPLRREGKTMEPARFFKDDDTQYLRWLANHPDGYVVNTQRGISPHYMVLHRATCPTISVPGSRARPGGFTERGYAKACADTVLALRAWVQANGRLDGTFSSEACPFCKP
jgi:hypothetical protein